MTEEEYKEELYYFIDNFGYWCKTVKELNNKALDSFGLKRYQELHNEVKQQIREEAQDLDNIKFEVHNEYNIYRFYH